MFLMLYLTGNNKEELVGWWLRGAGRGSFAPILHVEIVN